MTNESRPGLTLNLISLFGSILIVGFLLKFFVLSGATTGIEHNYLLIFSIIYILYIIVEFVRLYRQHIQKIEYPKNSLYTALSSFVIALFPATYFIVKYFALKNSADNPYSFLIVISVILICFDVFMLIKRIRKINSVNENIV